MPERYRTDYDGEFVIVSNTIKNGKKHQEREWIENPIENQHISGRAAVIGNGDSRYITKVHGKFNLKNNIEQHAVLHPGLVGIEAALHVDMVLKVAGKKCNAIFT